MRLCLVGWLGVCVMRVSAFGVCVLACVGARIDVCLVGCVRVCISGCPC